MGINLKEAWSNSVDPDHDDRELKASDTHWKGLIVDIINIDKKEKDSSVYLFKTLRRLSAEDKDLPELFSEIQKGIINYLSAMDRHTMSKMEQRDGTIDVNDRESADRSRTIAHDSLIASINIYARQCQKKGLDIEWRRVLGSDRTNITRWVLGLADYFSNEILNK